MGLSTLHTTLTSEMIDMGPDMTAGTDDSFFLVRHATKPLTHDGASYDTLVPIFNVWFIDDYS